MCLFRQGLELYERFEEQNTPQDGLMLMPMLLWHEFQSMTYDICGSSLWRMASSLDGKWAFIVAGNG